MKAKEKMVLLGIFLLFSSKSLVSYSNFTVIENNKDLVKDTGNAIQAYENQNKINNATLTISGDATGMVASREPSIVENRGTIVVNGGTAKAMQSTGVGAKGINNGIINHSGDGAKVSNAMFSQNGGYIENGKLGVINISGKDSSGMLIQGVKDEVNSQGINKGIINVSYGKGDGESSVNGVKVSASGIGINEGTINLQTNNTVGFLVSGENAQGINETTGVINVSGNNSVGIKVSESSKKNPIAENKGIINVTAGAGTVGMQAFGIGTQGINSGIINHEGDGVNISNAILSQNGGYVENTETGIINISGKDSSGMMIQGAVKDGIVTVSQGTNRGIINVSYGALTEKMGQVNGIKVSANGIGKNEGIINLQTNNTAGFLVLGENALGVNEKNGVINVSGNKSVGISISGKGIGTNNGNIYVTGGEFTSGMQAVGADSKGINNGTIIHVGNGKTSNAMLAQTGGYIENNRLIQVSAVNVSGMAADKEGSSLKNLGDILVLNKAKGIKLSGGATGTSSGKIVVEEGIGISIETGAKGENRGDISITGNSSSGISISGAGQGVNAGNIYVSGKQYTAGIKADGLGSVGINNGTIIHEGDGQTSNAVLAQGGATVENNGLIQTSGINTSAMSATGADSKVLNNENGKITVFDKALGMKIEKNGYGENLGVISNNSTGIGMDIRSESSGKNSGLIENYSVSSGVKVAGQFVNTGEIKNYNFGNAVLVSNGTFVNEGGVIDGGYGVAIRSEVLRLKDPITEKYYDAPTNNNVVLKGGKVKGDILGGVGIDALFFQGDNNLSDIRIENYEILSATGGNSKIDNSFIDLEYNQGNQAYFDENKNKLENDGIITADKGKLEISNSTLVVDFKNSLTDKTLENSIISADKLVLNGDVSFSFISGDGRNEFNLSEAFGGVDIELGENANIKSSVIWDYEVKDGNIIAKKNSYENILTTSKLSKFVTLLEGDRIEKSALEAKNIDKSLIYAVSDAEQLQTAGEFTSAMKQLSGGVYGYMADIASINSRTLSKRMMDRVNQSDFTRERATNSSTQDVIYMDNNHRINGLMDVSYIEHGILGVTEKQIENNAKLGLIYGGSNGKVKFEGGEYGSADLNNIYVGGYYNYKFTDRFSLTSNARITNSFNSLKRTVNYGNTYGSFDSTFPTYGFGLGTVAAYNVLKDDYKFGVYGGIDWTKIVQGNITEDPLPTNKPQNELAINSKGTVDEEFYDSVVPKAGILLEKTGYLFGKKYVVGGNFEYETELGNIKDGKVLKLQGLSEKHRIETTKMENMLSYNIFASLNLTEDFSLLGSYTSTKSKEYDSDSLTVGGKYKFNSVGDVVNTYFDNLSGNKSDRWRGTVNILLEAEDDSDRTYFDMDGNPYPGDYAASTLYVPKLTMSLNDLKSKWSYYFEGYYKDNEMFQGLKTNEAEQHATRVHLEARWNDTFSRGRYGINIAYRNETSEKPQNYGKKGFREVKRGVHQIRLTPNFIYNLGNGFALNGSSTNIYEYNYIGDKEGQGDFIMENQGGIDYSGLMPRAFMRLNLFREDTWHDHNNATERKRLTQIRPTFRYFFGNGAYTQLEARFPIYNGGYSNDTRTQIIKSENYETRYSLKYIQPLAPGLTGTIGATLLTIKAKNKATGNENRYHSFRPMVGVSYSF
ncbi:autotransporter outer membrane beta-barrel domain-containing protein [Cetobacterium sp. 2G large]|uniref:autotransporter outer membrane beta-barrel domain-containing protein n=1 Tax=Cetobacterium sp. 2G large TaxID=2759680 RepID=UPI00163C2208|nr:autotransporter outer membrane beta-barrel domain-containing protein [Cetobacterium sp. 2G large]MBC2854201.1 autotransporter domain-containing protein [Cetobacterium sp. 2G large]